MTTENEQQLIEPAPSWAEGVAALASWSGNYDQPTPYALFCDLIGFNGEEFGECYFLPSVPGPYDPPAKEELFQVDEARRFAAVYSNLIDARLGFLELGMLADALGEYAERPQDVTAYVRRISEADRED